MFLHVWSKNLIFTNTINCLSIATIISYFIPPLNKTIGMKKKETTEGFLFFCICPLRDHYKCCLLHEAFPSSFCHYSLHQQINCPLSWLPPVLCFVAMCFISCVSVQLFPPEWKHLKGRNSALLALHSHNAKFIFHCLTHSRHSTHAC